MKKENCQKKIQKKGYYFPEELKEIKAAMEEEGYKNWSDYSMHLIRTRRERTDGEKRRTQMFKYRYANLQTLHNKLMLNIDPQNTMREIMKEMDELCQELV